MVWAGIRALPPPSAVESRLTRTDYLAIMINKQTSEVLP